MDDKLLLWPLLFEGTLHTDSQYMRNGGDGYGDGCGNGKVTDASNFGLRYGYGFGYGFDTGDGYSYLF